MSTAVICDDTLQALWAKCHIFVWNFPVLVTNSRYKTNRESKRLAMAKAWNVFIQLLCTQVLLHLQTILLKEKVICKDSKNCNSKMWDVMTQSGINSQFWRKTVFMYRPPLPFYPEDGGNKFVQNNFLVYTVSYTQNIIFVVTAVSTSNPTKLYCYRKSNKIV